MIYPLRQAALVPKISAPVLKFFVERGSHVRAGELLAQLEDRDLAAAVTDNKGAFEQAEAAYETATKQSLPEEIQKAELDTKAAHEAMQSTQKVYQGQQNLFAQGATARKNVDDANLAFIQARNQYDLARVHLESLQKLGKAQELKSAEGQLTSARGKYSGAQAQLSFAEVRSPIDGVVTERPLYPGEMAAAGSPLITVMDLSQVVARAHIDQQQAGTQGWQCCKYFGAGNTRRRFRQGDHGQPRVGPGQHYGGGLGAGCQSPRKHPAGGKRTPYHHRGNCA